ncbi:MAG TPA: PVC-type heme-binding CxxCH protein, partial [Opitutaceae bacterium]
DGDGKFDKQVVFAENMMFPQGALFYEGSLYVGAPPHIWKLTDKDGDGTADERVAWYDGKTLTGCANDLHGPYLGPDGWIYWTKGAFAEQTHTLPSGQPFVTRAAHIFRARPDSTGFEPVLTGGMDNPVGVAFTSAGERILSGTFFQTGVPGKRDGLIHAIYGGVYGKDQAAVATGHIRTGDLMPIMTHMGAAAPCGSTAYRSQAFGAEYADNLFVCYFNLRKVSRHQLVRDGATYKTIDTDFVTSDSPDFRPTDVLEDADGSLLVVDTGGWYKICCPTSQLAKPDVLGGIYRIRKTSAPAIADPRGLRIAWDKQTPAELAKLLRDSRPYVVERATHELGKRGTAAIPALDGSAHALWALARIDTPAARAAIRSALASSDHHEVQIALQLVSLARDRAASEALGRIVSGTDPLLARLAAEALGRIGDARSAAVILSAAAKLPASRATATGTPELPGDRVLEHALIYALVEIGQPAALLSQFSATTPPRVARIALVALDQMAGSPLAPAHVLPFLTSAEPQLRQTAGWIVGHRPSWGGALAEHYRAQLAKDSSDSADLQLQLSQLASAPEIQNLLAETARSKAVAASTRLLVLRAMAAAPLKQTPAIWHADLAALLATSDAGLTPQLIATARALPKPKTLPPAFTAALARFGRDTQAPAALRLDALAIAPESIGALEPALFDFVRAHLAATQPLALRATAATILAQAPLSAEQQLALADAMKTVGALEAPKLLPAFQKRPTDTLGLRLVAALRDSPAQAGLRGNALKPTLAKYSATVQSAAEPLLVALNASAAKENARVEALIPAARKGDIRRGQEVFNSEKTACILCHTMGHRGGKLGPDLTRIGAIRDERELLEAIMFPSATFVRGYEPMIATTSSGEAHSGILRKDAADEIVLATGPESEQRISRAALTDLQPGAFSPMPPGMDVVLTAQELADLTAFLKSLK